MFHVEQFKNTKKMKKKEIRNTMIADGLYYYYASEFMKLNVAKNFHLYMYICHALKYYFEVYEHEIEKLQKLYLAARKSGETHTSAIDLILPSTEITITRK